MKKYFILTIISILIGYMMAKLIFVSYETNEVIETSSNVEKYYFFQLGAFSKIDSIKETIKIPNYIYINENDLYYVFGCITKNKDNIDKINNYYKSIGYSTYVKEFNISDKELNDSVDKIDLLINNSDDINKLCMESISKYKEG